MKIGANLRELSKVTEAMLTLSHGEDKAAYDRTLAVACAICSLCGGRGWIGIGQKDFDGECFRNKLPCAACQATGKSTPAP